MVHMLRTVGVDGFLGNLLALMLMGNTVIPTTGREVCKKNFHVSQFWGESGMIVNERKAKFFVIKG